MKTTLEVIKKLTLPILFVTIMLVGTLGGAHSQVQGPRYGGTMVMAQSNEPGSIFYYANGATEVGVVATNIFNGLVAYDVAFNPIPDLAGSWERSADQLTWTFHLVKNATFHDGGPFTSADVKFTYENLVQLSANGRLYFPITSGDLWITTPDNYTAVFNWKAPFIEAFKDMGVFAT
ncbi:MAG: ABC transporter substrate-binding protein, partial [Candidatus Bathyarchaeia archaeon]